jgi:putative transposase
LQRKKRGSHRRSKQRQRFAWQCQRVANVRKDFHHKAARALVRANDVIYHEELAVKNMVQNHCLARSIHDAAWSPFLSILTSLDRVAARI